MKLIRLTRPDGHDLYVGNGITIEPVTVDLKEDWAPEAKTRIWISGVPRFVIEDVETVVAQVEGELE